MPGAAGSAQYRGTDTGGRQGAVRQGTGAAAGTGPGTGGSTRAGACPGTGNHAGT